jgi:hypothetical protein
MPLTLSITILRISYLLTLNTLTSPDSWISIPELHTSALIKSFDFDVLFCHLVSPIILKATISVRLRELYLFDCFLFIYPHLPFLLKY